jgi:hypothetical protein
MYCMFTGNNPLRTSEPIFLLVLTTLGIIKYCGSNRIIQSVAYIYIFKDRIVEDSCIKIVKSLPNLNPSDTTRKCFVSKGKINC